MLPCLAFHMGSGSWPQVLVLAAWAISPALTHSLPSQTLVFLLLLCLFTLLALLLWSLCVKVKSSWFMLLLGKSLWGWTCRGRSSECCCKNLWGNPVGITCRTQPLRAVIWDLIGHHLLCSRLWQQLYPQGLVHGSVGDGLLRVQPAFPDGSLHLLLTPGINLLHFLWSLPKLFISLPRSFLKSAFHLI